MRTLTTLALAGLMLAGLAQPILAREAEDHAHGGSAIPSSLTDEHHEVLTALKAATRAGGRTGEAARALEATLMPHFQREEAIALPPLGLLPRVSQGQVSPDMRATLTLTEELKREMPRMLSEHQAILARLEALEAAATAERRAEVLRFAHQLKAHAVTEEQILYPTSLLIGEYLRRALRP